MKEQWFKILKEVAIGAQNYSYDMNTKVKDLYEYVETRSHTFPAGQSQYKFDEKDHDKNYGYTNLRIVSDISKIDKMTYSIGNGLIDETRPYLLKERTPFASFQEHALPALQYHDYRVTVTCDEPATIEYDIVKFKEDCKSCKERWIHYYDCRSATMQVKGCASILLDFNQMTSDIWANISAPSAKNVYIEFMKKGDCRIRLHKIGDLWYCNLDDLNLSRVDNVVLHYDTEGEKHSTEVYAKNLNCIRFMSGMAGLGYQR